MDDNHADDTPTCYTSALGIRVHGPYCTCPEVPHLEAHAGVAEVGAEGTELR